MEIYKTGNGIIELVEGNITKYNAEALVCPANPGLVMDAIPGGIQNAFLRDGGKEIFLEALKLGFLYSKMSKNSASPEFMSAGETSAHLTNAGKLDAKYVIHSVCCEDDKEEERLYCNKNTIAKSTKNVLELAREKKIKSVGFPALGTGLYQVSLEDCVDAISDEFIAFLNNEKIPNKLGLVLYSEDGFEIGKRILDKKFN